MNTLIELVYQLATAMLVPVLLLLLVMAGWALFSLGGFLREWRGRRLSARQWHLLAAQIKTAKPQLALQHADLGSLSFLLASLVRIARVAPESDVLEKGLADMEIRASGRLARLSLGVRLGPLLGLMGTLIPLGPALKGLAHGDVTTMSQNLVIVFSTTVLGIFIGGLCYVMLLARRQWYAHDLAEAEALVRSLLKQETTTSEYLTCEIEEAGYGS